MDRNRLAEIDALFAEALEHPAEERSAFIAVRCGGDEALRSEVAELLALARAEDQASQGGAMDLAGSFVRRLPNGAGNPLRPGAQVGAYTLVRRLAEGGMGVVFLAERTDGTFERQVALKVLPEVLTSPEAVQRFERERQILARLQHPNIAHLLDGGVDPRGLPYLVMEYVEGLQLDEYCDRRRLSIEDRIRLVITIAHAVQAAHRNLVIHRDLKPGNLLVTAQGEVKLLDFGIAKLTDDDADSLTINLGALPLTPTYASPEQIAGEPVTTASDVYQLGLILYELLTGRRPQQVDTGSLVEMVEQICEHKPPPPSRAVVLTTETVTEEELANRAALRGSTPGRLARRLRSDLDAVVERALAKAPEERYAGLEQMAEDLERFLEKRPVEARRDSLLDRLVKWTRRNTAVAVTLGLALLLTLGYAVAATYQARVIADERDRARQEARKAAEVERFLVDLFEVSDPSQSRGRTVTAHELLERGAARAEDDLAEQPAVQARMFSTLGQVHAQLGHYEEAATFHQQALDLRRALHGEGHPDVVESHHRLGFALRKAGDYEAAEPPLRRALEQRRSLPGIPPGDLGSSLMELGNLHYYRGEWEDAEALFGENLTLRRDLQTYPDSKDDGALAEALNAMGLLCFSRGEGMEAETYYRQALELRRKVNGNLHPAVAVSLFNLGQAFQLQEDYASAQPHFEEALAIEGQIFGENHPEYARTMLATGNNLQILGRLDEAEALFSRTRKIFESSLEPDHPDRISILQAIAQLRTDQGRFQEAEALLRQAIDMRQVFFGPDHVQVALLHFPLAQCLEKQERYREALMVGEEGLKMVTGRHHLAESQLTNLIQGLRRRLTNPE